MRITIIFFILAFICSCVSNQADGYAGDLKERNDYSLLDGIRQMPKELSPIEYVHWVEDAHNGLRVKKQQGSFIYELQYQPLEYLVALQERKEELEKSVLEKEIEERDGFEYFTLKISTIRGKGLSSDEKIIIANKEWYFLSGMQKDITMLCGDDTIKCAMLHVELSNNFIPYDQCLLAFEKPKNSGKDIRVIFRTDQYEKGCVELNIKRKSINKTPKLKTI